jgi:hypothetical protein
MFNQGGQIIMEDKTGKNLRIGAIVLMGLTATMNIAGGIGTTCAAFLTRDFPPMWSLYDYRLLYQIFVVVTTIIGIANVWVAVGLVRGRKNVVRHALITLVLGTIIGAIHVFASESLREKSVPANFVLYANILTLIVFLVLGTPNFRDRVNFSGPSDSGTQSTAAGTAAIMAGLLLLSVPMMVASTHIYQGENWVDVLRTTLNVGGGLLIGGGLLRLIGGRLKEAARMVFRSKQVISQ